MIKKLILITLLCSFTPCSLLQATDSKLSTACLSEKYKATLNFIGDITDPDDISRPLRSLLVLIDINADIPSLDILKKATSDALGLLRKAADHFQSEKEYSIMHNYLEEYNEALPSIGN